MRGVVSDVHVPPELGETSCHIRLPGIRTGHFVSEIREHFRDSAHADPADADEMNPVRAAGHPLLEPETAGPIVTAGPSTPRAQRLASSSARSTMTRAASGRASA